MTPPPSAPSSSTDPLLPDTLLAVACPSCFGAIAVPAALQGRAAECPLCLGGFRAPMPPSTPRPDAAARRPSAAALPTSTGSPPAVADVLATIDAPPATATAAIPGMTFREPVSTVGSGDNVIELRRLTPQEKAARRARRNLIMLLVGIAILMAIVQVFGTSRR